MEDRPQRAGAQHICSDLAKRSQNRFALEGIGYLARDMGDRKAAEQFFNRLAQSYPDDYIPFLALADMYTDAHDFQRADANYQLAWKRAPKKRHHRRQWSQCRH